jgi:restriction system protein
VRPRRAHVQITPRGKEVLAENPVRIDVRFLGRYAEYQEFRTRSAQNAAPSDGRTPEDDQSTPLEAIAQAINASNAALATDVLQRILDQPPIFLERLVLKLLTAMGYGGRAVLRSIGAGPATAASTVSCARTSLA